MTSGIKLTVLTHHATEVSRVLVSLSSQTITGRPPIPPRQLSSRRLHRHIYRGHVPRHGHSLVRDVLHVHISPAQHETRTHSHVALYERVHVAVRPRVTFNSCGNHVPMDRGRVALSRPMYALLDDGDSQVSIK